jgi:hypothetical protein
MNPTIRWKAIIISGAMNSILVRKNPIDFIFFGFERMHRPVFEIFCVRRRFWIDSETTRWYRLGATCRPLTLLATLVFYILSTAPLVLTPVFCVSLNLLTVHPLRLSSPPAEDLHLSTTDHNLVVLILPSSAHCPNSPRRSRRCKQLLK